ncbi:histidine phosphatase family protein [Fulvivirga lutea]|uniref:Histidine phosphatase family protein n=1 Tax=Fulvivirga lutea TaxID=2810512 RepID=A0A974WEF3_9BACT|nr:histidine phosphatase family protein [Fulvivirga lutea]QSE96839.1 histidine phosphatase family protein [Fulvivirga lutea]
MKSKKIYLVRHGQTDFNLKGIVQGSGVDSSLNDKGRLQADQFYRAYKHINFDKIYTSSLKRSVESVQNFIDDGIPYEQLSGLNEINWGTREGTKVTPEEDAYYHSVIKAWQEGDVTLPIEGGECPEDVFKRQTEALQIIESDNSETILVCMHGRAMRILLCQMLNYPLHCMDTFGHSNLCLYVLNYSGSLYSVEVFNNTNHLK